jgi:hypothetical protein
MRWAGYVACMTAKMNTYSFSVEKPEETRALGKLKKLGGE